MYQARLALAECLRYAYSESDIEVSIEKFDDVAFEKDASPLDMLQTKHHLSKSGDLTDTSVDLWKTLRVWAEAVTNDPSLPGRTRFALVTTSQAPDDSAAALLRPALSGTPPRDPEGARQRLIEVAQTSKNAALAKAFDAFTALAPAMQASLLSAIEVLDGAPKILDLDSLIEERLKMMAPRGKACLAREQIEGWWWPRICAALAAESVGTIPILELEQKLDDIREGMKRDALPPDMEDADPSDSELEAYEQMRFVKQLSAVGVGLNRIQFAMRDYYRAFAQRSQWTRQSLLFDGEVSRFERTLVEEWEPRFAAMCEEIDDGGNEGAVCKAARDLYHWVEAQARFPFRSIARRFLNVGSYHMLANDLRIGWHKDYQTLFAENDDEGGHGS